MVKLCEVAGTRYFIDANEGPFKVLQNALDKCVKDNPDIEIDVADCRFGPATANRLSQLSKNYRLRNTEFPILDTALRHNFKLDEAAPSEEVEYIRGNFSNLQEVLDYLEKVRVSGKVYMLATNNYAYQLPAMSLAAVIQLMYPEVIVDVDAKLNALFELVRVEWKKTRKSHDKYWQVVGSNLLEIERNEKGLFEIPMVGEFSEQDLVSSFVVLPVEFSAEVLYKEAEYRNVHKELLRKVIIPKRKEKKLSDYVGTKNWRKTV